MVATRRSNAKRTAAAAADGSGDSSDTSASKRPRTGPHAASRGRSSPGNANPTAADMAQAAQERAVDEMDRLRATGGGGGAVGTGSTTTARRVGSARNAAPAASDLGAGAEPSSATDAASTANASMGVSVSAAGAPVAASAPSGAASRSVSAAASTGPARAPAAAAGAAATNVVAGSNEPEEEEEEEETGLHPNDPRGNLGVYAPGNASEIGRGDSTEHRQSKMRAQTLAQSKKGTSGTRKTSKTAINCFNSQARRDIGNALKGVAATVLSKTGMDRESKYYEGDKGSVKILLAVYSDVPIYENSVAMPANESERRKVVSLTESGRKPLLVLVSDSLRDVKGMQKHVTQYLREYKDLKNDNPDATLEDIPSFNVHELYGNNIKRTEAESFWKEATNASSRQQFQGARGHRPRSCCRRHCRYRQYRQKIPKRRRQPVQPTGRE